MDGCKAPNVALKRRLASSALPSFHVAFEADGVPIMPCWSRIAEQANEEIGQKMRQNFLLAETIHPAGRDLIGPMGELRRIDGWQCEARQMRPEHVGAKEWLGFNWHVWPCGKAAILRAGKPKHHLPCDFGSWLRFDRGPADGQNLSTR
ncbi:MAG: hypothetical protein WD648_09080 [Planctomycetaceae bacterium]